MWGCSCSLIFELRSLVVKVTNSKPILSSKVILLVAETLYKNSCLAVLATFSSLVCDNSDVRNPKAIKMSGSLYKYNGYISKGWGGTLIFPATYAWRLHLMFNPKDIHTSCPQLNLVVILAK